MREITLDPGRKIGVTADTHYGHANIISYCLRPFTSPEEAAVLATAGDKPKLSAATLRRQNDALVEGINNVLGPDDVLIHAGDVAWGKIPVLFEFRSRLNVREIYVAVGNHDNEGDLAAVFGRDNVMERFLVEVGGQRAVIDHYPGYSWQESHKSCWQLFGHVHGAENAKRRQDPAWSLSIDVGVDSHDFKPWLWKEELVPLFADRKPAFDRWHKQKYSGKGGGGMAPQGPV